MDYSLILGLHYFLGSLFTIHYEIGPLFTNLYPIQILKYQTTLSPDSYYQKRKVKRKFCIPEKYSYSAPWPLRKGPKMHRNDHKIVQFYGDPPPPKKKKKKKKKSTKSSYRPISENPQNMEIKNIWTPVNELILRICIRKYQGTPLLHPLGQQQHLPITLDPTKEIFSFLRPEPGRPRLKNVNAVFGCKGRWCSTNSTRHNDSCCDF